MKHGDSIYVEDLYVWHKERDRNRRMLEAGKYVDKLLQGIKFTVTASSSHLVTQLIPNNFAQGVGIFFYHILLGKKIIKTCKQCGVLFAPEKRKDKKTCSDRCRKQLSISKKRMFKTDKCILS